MVITRGVLVSCLVGVVAASAVARPPAPPAAPAEPAAAPPDPYQREVIANILDQTVGGHTIADFALPDPLLGRLADRFIREAYFRQYHRVLVDIERESPPEPEPPGEPRRDRFRVIESRPHPEVLEYRRSLPIDRPERRGFKAPILDDAHHRWPAATPDDGRLRRVAGIVGAGLAGEGLLLTTARAIDALGAERFGADDADVAADMTAALDDLWLAGLPVDLLRCFSLDGEPLGKPDRVVAAIARRLADGEEPDTLRTWLSSAQFEYMAAKDCFVVASESGDGVFDLLRVQLARGTYWRGPGGGDSVDMLRQLVEQVDDVSYLVSIEQKHVEPLLATASAWPPVGGDLTIVAEPMTVSQWAQDAGKAGLVCAADAPRPATLVPRYASRRADGSELIPGDSFLAEGLARAGHPVVHSSLLFQGGNLLAVREPDTGHLVLLVGEAEVARNVALGLTRDQALAALRRELGADRCVVLPALSIHLDYDVSARAVGDEVVAFVNDTDAAIRLVVEAGLGPLVEAGVVSDAQRDEAVGHLRARRDEAFMRLVTPLVYEQAHPRGGYKLSLARHFKADAADSDVGNLQRFLVALDMMVSFTAGEDFQPPSPLIRSCLRSFRRLRGDEAALRAQLAGLGWRVVPVPSLAMDTQSINALNGLHDRTRYVMPVYGGLYANVDAAAEAALQAAMGQDVQIIPVRCGESQRRAGGVHCSVVAYPEP